MSLVVNEGTNRGAAHRELARQYLHDIETWNSVEKIMDIALLDHDEFIAYHKNWKNWNEDKAQAEWDAALANPEVQKEEEEDGTVCVPVRMPKKYRATEGRKEKKTVRTGRSIENRADAEPVSYTHLRAHETGAYL
eukprot:3862682-Pyramimonas_sp.AAC.2